MHQHAHTHLANQPTTTSIRWDSHTHTKFCSTLVQSQLLLLLLLQWSLAAASGGCFFSQLSLSLSSFLLWVICVCVKCAINNEQTSFRLHLANFVSCALGQQPSTCVCLHVCVSVHTHPSTFSALNSRSCSVAMTTNSNQPLPLLLFACERGRRKILKEVREFGQQTQSFGLKANFALFATFFYCIFFSVSKFRFDRKKSATNTYKKAPLTHTARWQVAIIRHVFSLFLHRILGPFFLTFQWTKQQRAHLTGNQSFAPILTIIEYTNYDWCKPHKKLRWEKKNAPNSAWVSDPNTICTFFFTDRERENCFCPCCCCCYARVFFLLRVANFIEPLNLLLLLNVWLAIKVYAKHTEKESKLNKLEFFSSPRFVDYVVQPFCSFRFFFFSSFFSILQQEQNR